MKKRNKLFMSFTVLLAICLIQPVFAADKFPERPLEFVACYGPGGGHDIMMRTMANRITSYNVCYTKLLRDLRLVLNRCFGLGFSFRAGGRVMDLPHLSIDSGRSITLEFRITSYNVCYTKLLRTLSKRLNICKRSKCRRQYLSDTFSLL